MGVINLEILIKKIMSKIAGAGYVKNTDYASSTKGGTIKVDSTYATEVTSAGKLKAKEITAEAYSEANDDAFISKATLDNVLASQGGGGISPTAVYESTSGVSLGLNYSEIAMTIPDSYNFLLVEAKTTGCYASALVSKGAIEISGAQFAIIMLDTNNLSSQRQLLFKKSTNGLSFLSGVSSSNSWIKVTAF